MSVRQVAGAPHLLRARLQQGVDSSERGSRVRPPRERRGELLEGDRLQLLREQQGLLAPPGDGGLPLLDRELAAGAAAG